MDHSWGKEAAVDFWQLPFIISGGGRREHLTEALTAPRITVMFCQVGFGVDRRGFVTLRSTFLGGHPDPSNSAVLHVLTASSFPLTSIQRPKPKRIFQTQSPVDPRRKKMP